MGFKMGGSCSLTGPALIPKIAPPLRLSLALCAQPTQYLRLCSVALSLSLSLSLSVRGHHHLRSVQCKCLSLSLSLYIYIYILYILYVHACFIMYVCMYVCMIAKMSMLGQPTCKISKEKDEY